MSGKRRFYYWLVFSFPIDVEELLARDPNLEIENQLIEESLEIDFANMAINALQGQLDHFPTRLEQDQKLYESMQPSPEKDLLL